MKSVLSLVTASLLLLGACSQDPAESAAPESSNQMAEDTSGPGGGPAPEFYSADGLIGRWTGVEGMYLDIQPTGDGHYTLEMQSDLDTKGTYTGTPTANGIEFDRGGAHFVLREATGAQTGLKYLDGKQDCLMVATGEGYCRDSAADQPSE